MTRNIFKGELCLLCGRYISLTAYSQRNHGEQHVEEGRAFREEKTQQGTFTVYLVEGEPSAVPCVVCGASYCRDEFCVARGIAKRLPREGEPLIEGQVVRKVQNVGTGGERGLTGFRLNQKDGRAAICVFGLAYSRTPSKVKTGDVLRVEIVEETRLRYLHNGVEVYRSPELVVDLGLLLPDQVRKESARA